MTGSLMEPVVTGFVAGSLPVEFSPRLAAWSRIGKGLIQRIGKSQNKQHEGKLAPVGSPRASVIATLTLSASILRKPTH